jgi:transposase
MEQVLDVYKRPFDEKRPVVCMDESPKQLISEVKSSVPMAKGRVERIDYEYVRHGMVNIFIANEPLKGKRMIQVTEFKKKQDWAKFIKKISDDYPDAEKITLVMDNFKTHSPSSLYETFEPEEAKRIWDRFEFVFTPRHGSWLNMAEIELHVLSSQCLSRHISTMEEITKEIKAWENDRNNKNSKINWQFTTKDSRVKLRRLYPSIQN